MNAGIDDEEALKLVQECRDDIKKVLENYPQCFIDVERDQWDDDIIVVKCHGNPYVKKRLP